MRNFKYQNKIFKIHVYNLSVFNSYLAKLVCKNLNLINLKNKFLNFKFKC